MEKCVEKLVAKRCTIEAVVKQCVYPRAWYNFWTPKFSVVPFLFHASKHVSKAPDNLFLLTNTGYSESTEQKHEITSAEISRVCSEIRSSLMVDSMKNKRPWILIIDTDGGENHELTKLGIGLADSIIIPLSADMNARDDAMRLPILFDFAQKLRSAKLSNATVDYAFFNRLESQRNEPWEGLAVTPHKDVQDIMTDVKKLFDGWIPRYPDLLRAMAQPFSECMGAVRTGGKDFRKAAEDPWENDAGNAQNDLKALTCKLMSLKSHVKNAFVPLNLSSKFEESSTMK